MAASAVTLTRPAQAALLPALVDTPAQLTAANVVTGWVDNVTLLAGPALAGVALAVASPGWALVLFAGIVAVSAVVVAPVHGVVLSAHDLAPVDAEQPKPVQQARPAAVNIAA